MISAKNLTPRQLSFFTALFLAIPVGLLVFAYEKRWVPALISFIFLLLAGHLLIAWMLEKFIYRKIKLIYKFIYQTKASKREETYYKYILPRKSIDEVRQDVEQWAGQRSAEIELLRHNEAYRKEFLQNLAHEFKTPIFAIQGYVDTLLQGALENPEINKRFLQKAAKNVERLVNLIEDLDEISKLERGEITLHQQNFVIQELVRDVFENLSWKGEPKKISFSIKKGCEKALLVFGDKEKIRQVLINLVDNAIKYGKHNGSVVASMYQTDGNNVLVEISDDGMGIPEKFLDRIFERFYRTTEGRNRDATGSGLGLAICKHIVEAHGQSMHVRSKENVGTTIGFTISNKKD